MFVCLSARLSIPLHVYPSTCLSVCILSTRLSVSLSVSLSVCLFVILSVCMSIRLHVYLSVCRLSVCLIIGTNKKLQCITSCISLQVEKHSTTILSAMMTGMDDRDDPESDLTLEAMAGLSKILAVVDDNNVRHIFINICLRIRPCFEKVSRTGIYCRVSHIMFKTTSIIH